MALLQIDQIEPHLERDRIIRILNYKVLEEGKYAVYTIQLQLGDIKWTVERRYSHFEDFDRRRFRNTYGKKLSFLPPKKLVGNMEQSFLMERQVELEKYLRTTLELELWLRKKQKTLSISRELARFLDFHQYEVHAIVEDLAARLSKCGDRWLEASTSKPKFFEFTPIELHAVSERLKMTVPSFVASDASLDVAHVVEFLHRVGSLKIRGTGGHLGTSNIEGNSLPLSLASCKNAQALWLTDANASSIYDLDDVKRTVKYLVVHYSIKRLSDILVDKSVPGPVQDMQSWASIEEADLSFNEISHIDESVMLLRRCHKVNLSNNCLTDIGTHLQHIHGMTELNLSSNGLERLDQWHSKLGNVTTLNIAANSIRSLSGLAKMYSLEFLDASDNALCQVTDVWPVGSLPNLRRLTLKGNPLENAIEYRTRVLEAFRSRAHEISLDGQKATQRELDTVGVRLAIRKAKEEKEALLERTRLQIGEKLRFLTADDSSYVPSSSSS